MFEQLTQLVQQYSDQAIVKNDAIPNEQNQAVMEEAGGTIFSSLKDLVAAGHFDELASMLSGKTSIDNNNPIVAAVSEKVTGNLGSKFGLSTETASGISQGLIPQILSGLVTKAQDPSQPGFSINDLIGAISGNSNSGLMDAVSKLGGQLGFDQDGNGQVGINEVIDAVSNKKGGIGGFLSSFFGK